MSEALSPFERRPWLFPLLTALFFSVLSCLLFAPLFLPGRWLTWDVPEQYWADLSYLCRSLHAHRWPLWNPYDRSGYPFHADPQSGLYYPLNHALCLLSGPDPGLRWAESRAVLHFALAGCATTAFLRRVGLARAACWLGGLVFMTAPFPRRMWELDLTYTLAWMPAVLWGIEGLVKAPSARHAAQLALVCALCTSVGSPPALYFTTLTASAWTLLRLAPRPRAWPYLALAGLLLGAMAVVLIVPTLELKHVSVQQDRAFASLTEGSYPPRELWGLFYLRNKYLYLGVPVLLLCILGAARPGPVPLGVRIGVTALLLWAAVMTLGSYSPVYRALFGVLPGVNLFRAPQRYSAVLGAAATVLAALGAEQLARMGRRWAVPLAMALVFASIWPALPPDRDTRTGPVPGLTPRFRALRARTGDIENAWRVWDEYGLSMRAGTRFRIRDFRGYQDPLISARYEQLLWRLHETPHLLEQYNVRWLFRGPHFLHGTEHHYLPAGQEPQLAEPRGDGVWETRNPLPLAYWTPAISVWTDYEALIERLRVVAPTPVCMLEDWQGPAPVSDAAPALVAGAHPHVEPELVRFEVDAPAAGCVVVNELYYEGWTARVDGRVVPIRRANYLMRSVMVGPGHHSVELRYEPRHYWAYLALGGVAAALSLALSLGLRLPRRRNGEGASGG